MMSWFGGLLLGVPMPLFDHFHLSAGADLDWDGFHSTWAVCITQWLNQNPLPPRYRARPHVHLGISVEADVATFEHDTEGLSNGSESEGGVATAVWAPPQPPLVATVEFGDLDIFEVKVFNDAATRSLVAAVELVSPANKDRPAHREAFATKCAAYLQQGVSVIVVDVVTERHNNLHEEIVRRLSLGDEAVHAVTSDLYAVAYRTAGVGKRMRLEAWPAALAVGAALPTLPLWLAPTLAVPLDLEATYRATCESLRIPT
jgi:hypothetical protein